MNLGKIRRLRRILGKDCKTLIVPMDHGVTAGPIKGLEDMQQIIDAVNAGGADAIIIHRGIAKCIDIKDLSLIVHLSASTNLGPNPLWKIQVCDVEDALRLGADAVSIHINVGADEEPNMLENFGLVASECEIYGIPLLAMMYPRGPKIKSEHDVEVVKHAARLGAELGADIVKTNYTGSPETFKEVVRGCPVPVVIAGGPKTKSTEEFLAMVYDAMQAGASGVSIGRNVFQHENPKGMVRALKAIIHEKATVEEALKILEETK